jgi:uncharacterized protein YukE
MSMSASKGRLAALTKELARQWDETKECWRDAKSQEFEQRYMNELLAGVNRTLASMDELGKVITKVEHDCE